jgi:hypothetical protein
LILDSDELGLEADENQPSYHLRHRFVAGDKLPAHDLEVAKQPAYQLRHCFVAEDKH